MKRKLYLSGPMTGIPNWNRASFDDAAKQLTDLGYEVINPFDLPEPVVSMKPSPAETWAAYLVRDILLLQEERPDFVVLLPGSENSNGSCLEARYAKEIGLATVTLGEVLSATYRPVPGHSLSWPASGQLTCRMCGHFQWDPARTRDCDAVEGRHRAYDPTCEHFKPRGKA